jgi:hypothetical protein
MTSTEGSRTDRGEPAARVLKLSFSPWPVAVRPLGRSASPGGPPIQQWCRASMSTQPIGWSNRRPAASTGSFLVQARTRGRGQQETLTKVSFGDLRKFY